MFQLPSKTPSEDKVVTFDFTAIAAAGATLSTPVIVKSLVSGTDTGATALTVGTATVSGLLVLVLVSGGLDGNRYELICTVDASNGEIHQLGAQMLVSTGAL